MIHAMRLRFPILNQ
ncbi:erythromycin resistance leader peptide [Lysinibacillus capsici]